MNTEKIICDYTEYLNDILKNIVKLVPISQIGSYYVPTLFIYEAIFYLPTIDKPFSFKVMLHSSHEVTTEIKLNVFCSNKIGDVEELQNFKKVFIDIKERLAEVDSDEFIKILKENWHHFFNFTKEQTPQNVSKEVQITHIPSLNYTLWNLD